MPNFNANVELETWEFVQACNKSEIKSLISDLASEGYLPEKYILGEEEKTICDIDWEEACLKILNKKHLLTLEDENTILKISQKLI
jgi:hypothetical protein